MEQDKVSKLSDEKKNVWDQDRSSTMKQEERKASYGERWDAARPTKTIVFWSWIGSIILTMIIGFAWGGWVTGGTAQKMAEVMAGDAVVQRLAPICVMQFNQDPEKDQKLEELLATNTRQRRSYVEKQSWAIMPGETKPERNVAQACAEQITQLSQAQ